MTPLSVPVVAPLIFPLSPFEVEHLFTFSPFGLGCRQCDNSVTLDERCIRDHAKKHGMDSRVGTIRPVFEKFKSKVREAKTLGIIEPYRSDNNVHMGFACLCGQEFHSRKGSAVRHCKSAGCDPSELKKVELMKLCCGPYVSQAQVTSMFTETAPRITEQFDYRLRGSIAYRRGSFIGKKIDLHNGFAIAYFLKDLMLEIPSSVQYHPVAVEFSLMSAFRVQKSDSKITMISCDYVSSQMAIEMFVSTGACVTPVVWTLIHVHAVP
jgi:hypothetical protein